MDDNSIKALINAFKSGTTEEENTTENTTATPTETTTENTTNVDAREQELLAREQALEEKIKALDAKELEAIKANLAENGVPKELLDTLNAITPEMSEALNNAFKKKETSEKPDGLKDEENKENEEEISLDDIKKGL